MAAPMSGACSTSDWLTIHEASALIGVSPATLRRWSDAGEIKAFTTPGGHRRFARSAVLGMLPATGRKRPSLETLGETRARLARVYRRHVGRATGTAAWVGELAEDERAPFREHGRRIANGLLAYLDADTAAEREAALHEAEEGTAVCSRIAAARGIPIADTVELFLRFRMPFLHELGEAARRRALETADATDLLESATEAIDRLLTVVLQEHAAVARERDDAAGDAGGAGLRPVLRIAEAAIGA